MWQENEAKDRLLGSCAVSLPDEGAAQSAVSWHPLRSESGRAAGKAGLVLQYVLNPAKFVQEQIRNEEEKRVLFEQELASANEAMDAVIRNLG